MSSLHTLATTPSTQEAVAKLKKTIQAIKAAGGLEIPAEMTLKNGYVHYKAVNNDFMGNFHFYVQANGQEWEEIEKYWVCP